MLEINPNTRIELSEILGHSFFIHNSIPKLIANNDNMTKKIKEKE